MIEPACLCVQEFDARGRLDIARSGQYAYLDVGEVKMTPDYASSVPQLGIRLGALSYFVRAACEKTEPEGVRMVGRMFVSKHGMGRNESIDSQQRDLAFEKWGYSLYLHRV